MDTATIHSIAEMARQAVAQKTFTVPAEPSNIYYLIKPDGPQRCIADPKPYRHEAADLSSILRLKPSQVWYSRKGIVGLLDKMDVNSDRVRMKLTPTEQLRKLQEMEAKGGGQTFKQAELIYALRTIFADNWAQSQPQLLSVVREIKMSIQTQTGSNVQQTKVSVNKSILAEMSGTQSLPELVIFKVAVFHEFAGSIEAEIRIAIDLVPASESFILTVLPGDTERALQSAESQIGERLQNAVTNLPADAENPRLPEVLFGEPLTE